MSKLLLVLGVLAVLSGCCRENDQAKIIELPPNGVTFLYATIWRDGGSVGFVAKLDKPFRSVEGCILQRMHGLETLYLGRLYPRKGDSPVEDFHAQAHILLNTAIGQIGLEAIRRRNRIDGLHPDDAHYQTEIDWLDSLSESEYAAVTIGGVLLQNLPKKDLNSLLNSDK